MQRREVAVPGTCVALIEDVLYAQTRNKLYLLQIERMCGMEVELREARSPTVAGTPASALQVSVQVDVETIVSPCTFPSSKYSSCMFHTTVGGFCGCLILLHLGIQFYRLCFCICKGIGSTQAYVLWQIECGTQVESPNLCFIYVVALLVFRGSRIFRVQTSFGYFGIGEHAIGNHVAHVVDEAAQLRYEAQLTGLELRTTGELGAHELVSAIEEAVAILGERQLALDQSMDTDILIAKQAYLTALEEGLITSEEAQKIYDQNLQDIFAGWASKSTELTQQILTFGLGKITQTMGVNIDTLMSDLTSHAKAAEGQSFQEIADDMSVQIGYMQNSVDADTRAAIEIIMKSMMPSVQQQQRVVSEMIKAGQKVDKGLIDGINDSMLLATLYGDAEAIMYTTGWQMSQSPTFYDALANTKGAFAELDEYARQGLANNVSIVYDAAGNLVLTTSDGIQHNLGPVTETLKANFEALGIALPESVGTGMDTGTSTTFGGDSGPVNNLYKAVDSKFAEKFVPGHFSQYGQNVRNGFKSGSTPSSSEFNATAQQYQNYVKSALGQYLTEKEFVKYGQAVPAGTKTGMGNGSDLSYHASWILRNINPKTDEVINGMKNIGGNLVKGIIEGMDKESKSQTTSNGIKNVGNKILSLTKYHTEIGSPSKLFADQVGYWLTQGIVVGMDQPDALIDPLETMYTNAKDWWDDNTMDIVGGDFEFTDESGKNHYMDIKDANNEQNTLLREQNELLRQILAKESSGGYYDTTGEAMIQAASYLNRRTGRTVIPVGG